MLSFQISSIGFEIVGVRKNGFRKQSLVRMHRKFLKNWKSMKAEILLAIKIPVTEVIQLLSGFFTFNFFFFFRFIKKLFIDFLKSCSNFIHVDIHICYLRFFFFFYTYNQGNFGVESW